jgi:hypothetical protein
LEDILGHKLIDFSKQEPVNYYKSEQRKGVIPI